MKRRAKKQMTVEKLISLLSKQDKNAIVKIVQSGKLIGVKKTSNGEVLLKGEDELGDEKKDYLKSILREKHEEILKIHKENGGKVFGEGFDEDSEDNGGNDYEDIEFNEYLSYMQQVSVPMIYGDYEKCPYVETVKTIRTKQYSYSGKLEPVTTVTSIFGDESMEQTDEFGSMKECQNRQWIIFPDEVDSFIHLNKLVSMLT